MSNDESQKCYSSRKILGLKHMAAVQCRFNNKHFENTVMQRWIYSDIIDAIDEGDYGKALKISCSLNNNKYINETIEHVYDLDCLNNSLSWASLNDNIEVATSLIRKGADDYRGACRMAAHCKNNGMDMIKLLAYPPIKLPRCIYRMSKYIPNFILSLATKVESLFIVKCNLPNSYDSTSLLNAVKSNNVKFIEYTFDEYPSVDRIISCMAMACDNNRVNIVNMLMNKYFDRIGMSLLYQAEALVDVNGNQLSTEIRHIFDKMLIDNNYDQTSYDENKWYYIEGYNNYSIEPTYTVLVSNNDNNILANIIAIALIFVVLPSILIMLYKLYLLSFYS